MCVSCRSVLLCVLFVYGNYMLKDIYICLISFLLQSVTLSKTCVKYFLYVCCCWFSFITFVVFFSSS